MSVQEVSMFRIICDGCGRSAQDGDYYAWTEAEHAIDEADDSGWLICDDGHFCNDCQEWDEERDEMVPKRQEVPS